MKEIVWDKEPFLIPLESYYNMAISSLYDWGLAWLLNLECCLVTSGLGYYPIYIVSTPRNLT